MDSFLCIKQINNMLESNMNDRLRELDITFTQLKILVFLYHNSQRDVSQKDICEFLKVKHTSLIDVLKRLENKKLIQRFVNRENARCNCVRLTENALHMVEVMEENRKNMYNMFFNGFSQEECEQLEYLLSKILSNLEG